MASGDYPTYEPPGYVECKAILDDLVARHKPAHDHVEAARKAEALRDSLEWDERNRAIQQQMQAITLPNEKTIVHMPGLATGPAPLDPPLFVFTATAKWLLAYLALAGALWALGGLF